MAMSAPESTPALRRALCLVVLLCVVAVASAPATLARQETAPVQPDPPLDAVRLMEAARERLVVGDTNAAIARALLARTIDPEIEIPAVLIERALRAQPVEGVPMGPDEQALFDLRTAVQDLEREVRRHSRTLEDVERDLRDDEQARPVVQRLEMEIDDLERRISSMERDITRLQRDVDRLRR